MKGLPKAFRARSRRLPGRKFWIILACAGLIGAGAGTGVRFYRKWKAGIPGFASEACRRRYLSFYEKPEIDVKIVFGYKDARPARFVADRYERAVFIQRLVRECKGENFACGFRRGEAD